MTQAMQPTPKAIPQPTANPKARKQIATPPTAFRRTETIPGKGTMTQVPFGRSLENSLGQLFTESSGNYRSSTLDSSENKEIGGIWLALSIILIIVTAFGAGFLIMKPLLNDR
ncbi:MAG: hypothetical protein HC800_25485 [Phormidesmis sp. RL_2_1]|nr:hypothetical protein [Phormidesmis sp. RL_2_1]